MAFPPTLVNPAVTGSVQISGTVNLTASNVTVQGSQSVAANQDVTTHDLKVILDAGTAVIGHVISDTGSVVNATISAAIPAGTNVIGHVIVDSGVITSVTAITNPLPAGTNVIGHVVTDTGSLTTVTGALPAGTNVIGHVIVDSWGTFTAALGNATGTVTGANVQEIATPLNWSITSAPGTASQATVTLAAGGAGVKHVLTGFSAVLSTTAASANNTVLFIRDGASGAGTIKQTYPIPSQNLAQDRYLIVVTGLNIPFSANTAFTIEWSGAAASLTESVNAWGYDVA